MCNECKFAVFFVKLRLSIQVFWDSVSHRVGSGWRYKKCAFFLDLQTLILRELTFYLKWVDRPVPIFLMCCKNSARLICEELSLQERGLNKGVSRGFKNRPEVKLSCSKSCERRRLKILSRINRVLRRLSPSLERAWRPLFTFIGRSM